MAPIEKAPPPPVVEKARTEKPPGGSRPVALSPTFLRQTSAQPFPAKMRALTASLCDLPVYLMLDYGGVNVIAECKGTFLSGSPPTIFFNSLSISALYVPNGHEGLLTSREKSSACFAG